jgi:hypothetical protein
MTLAALAAAGLVLRATAGGGVDVGPYRVFADPTYRGAIAAFGAPSSCRLVRNERAWAVARWRRLGVVAELVSFGALPPHRNACTAPAAMPIAKLRLTGARWRTALGLRLGDGVAALHRRYPRALPTHGWSGWFNAGWWIVWRRTRCAIGVCSSTFVRAPTVVAETRGGRVAAFVVVVGAEGD